MISMQVVVWNPFDEIHNPNWLSERDDLQKKKRQNNLFHRYQKVYSSTGTENKRNNGHIHNHRTLKKNSRRW